VEGNYPTTYHQILTFSQQMTIISTPRRTLPDLSPIKITLPVTPTPRTFLSSAARTLFGTPSQSWRDGFPVPVKNYHSNSPTLYSQIMNRSKIKKAAQSLPNPLLPKSQLIFPQSRLPKENQSNQKSAILLENLHCPSFGAMCRNERWSPTP
jgi:hypothetical protein